MRHRLYGQSIIWSQDLHPDLMDELFEQADFLKIHPRNKTLEGIDVAQLFFEESTRTRFSFETSVHHLGGENISTENARLSSSVAKGESLEDTVRTVAGYAQGIVLRHPDGDAAMKARDFLQTLDVWVPIINAGCGRSKGQHPTQSMLDLYTIKAEVGRTENLRVAMVGDPKRGRTVRSLAYLLGKYPGNHIDFVSPWQLAVENDILAYLRRHQVTFTQGENLDDVIDKADVVYMTRVQSEEPLEDGSMLDVDTSSYRLTTERMKRLQKHARVLHPLPKKSEIDPVISRFPQAAYFRQSDNGVPVRKALLEMVLGE